MASFLAVIDRISEWTGKVVSFLVVVATLVVIHGVVMRYALNAPTTYSLELTIYLSAVLYLLGGAYALRFGDHVRVDILYLRFSPRIRALADIATAPFFFAAICVLAYMGGVWTMQAIRAASTSGSAWNPIIWPVRGLIFLGAFLLFLQGIAKLIRDIRAFRQKANAK